MGSVNLQQMVRRRGTQSGDLKKKPHEGRRKEVGRSCNTKIRCTNEFKWGKKSAAINALKCCRNTKENIGQSTWLLGLCISPDYVWLHMTENYCSCNKVQKEKVSGVLRDFTTSSMSQVFSFFLFYTKSFSSLWAYYDHNMAGASPVSHLLCKQKGGRNK